MSNDSRRTPGVSRRSIVRTTAWSVPVVAVSAAAPAFAASSWVLGGTVSYAIFQSYTAALTFQPGAPATEVSLTFSLTGATWQGNPLGALPVGWTGARTSATVLTYTYVGTLPPAAATFRPARNIDFDFTNTLTIRLLVDGAPTGAPLVYVS